MECKKQVNLDRCTCSFSCDTKGTCCDCLSKHLGNNQLPGCCFPSEAEKTGDRGFQAFAKAWGL